MVRKAMRLATAAGWCWFRQMGAGPSGSLGLAQCPLMNISGLTMFSNCIVWCSPIQNSEKPSARPGHQPQVFIETLAQRLVGVGERHDEHAVVMGGVTWDVQGAGSDWTFCVFR
ncbi:MAG: hypothetical protein CM1200mP2_46450 [Planctomycetaceae bacterium]|nr:MAG: hypothetical protein CM1200mP2_46450 [Planctomycetaceae bacterium]